MQSQKMRRENSRLSAYVFYSFLCVGRVSPPEQRSRAGYPTFIIIRQNRNSIICQTLKSQYVYILLNHSKRVTVLYIVSYCYFYCNNFTIFWGLNRRFHFHCLKDKNILSCLYRISRTNFDTRN